MGAALRWRLIGDVGVDIEGRAERLSGQRCRAVAAYLVLHHGRRVTNEALVDALWGDGPPKTARNSVQRFVADLRRGLGTAADRIETVDGTYRLQLLVGDSVDAFELADAIDHARAALDDSRPLDALETISVGLDQVGGEPLGGIGDTEFGLGARVRLDESTLDAFDVRLEAQLALGRCAEVAAEARSLADRYPTRETLWAHLMSALYGAGRQHEALNAYQELRSHLVSELGVEPSPQLRDLEARILAQDEGLRSARVAAAPTPADVVSRLAVPATRFFGREPELDALAEMLGGDDGALVTVVGPGGSGKTRLAERLLARAGSDFDDVVVAELDGLVDPARVAPAVAAAAGLVGATDPGTALCDLVAERRVLMVLDNAEQVVDAVASLVTALMAAAPHLRAVVTSRQALGVTAEQRIDLAGLDVVGEHDASSAPAVELFVERARRQVPSFEADEQVQQICSLVGGLPLAIELAARWVSTMSTAQIADRINSDVGLLATDASDVPERQRTMLGVLQTTWTRLEPSQAALAASLAVFRGGFDLDAAHEVCDASPLDLQRLVARSVLTWLPGGRLEMHELVRQFAETQLDVARRETLRAAHAMHYLGRVERGLPVFIGSDPAGFIEWLDADFDNVVEAWNTAFESGLRAPLLGASETLNEYSIANGRETEVSELLERATALGGDAFVATMRARQIRNTWHRMPAEQVEQLYDRALALVGGDSIEHARCRVELAIAFAFVLVENTSEIDRARAQIAEARADADQVGADRYHAELDTSAARAAMIAGDFDEALELYERASTVFDRLGDIMRSSDCVADLAGLHAERGDAWAALVADRRALAMRTRRHDSRAAFLAHLNTGASYALLGAWADSEYHTTAAMGFTSVLTDTDIVPYLDCQLAELRVGQGRRDEAEELFVRGVDGLRESGYAFGLRLKLPEWARFLVDEARWLEAELVIDEARTLCEKVGGTHFLTLLDGLSARVAANNGDMEHGDELACNAATHVRDAGGVGHPFPIKTLADCMIARRLHRSDDEFATAIGHNAVAMVKRVASSITDPTYRRTYLALPQVTYVLSQTTDAQ